jgi:hypothetical protein
MFRKRKYCDEEKYNDEDKLKKAVRNGDEKMVRRLVKGGVILNSKCQDTNVGFSKIRMRSRVTCKLAIIGSRPVEWSG